MNHYVMEYLENCSLKLKSSSLHHKYDFSIFFE